MAVTDTYWVVEVSEVIAKSLEIFKDSDKALLGKFLLARKEYVKEARKVRILLPVSRSLLTSKLAACYRCYSVCP